MERRDLFRILAAGSTANSLASAQHAHGNKSGSTAAEYEPRFFTPTEYRSLDAVCETILPADETSGGAHQAGVAMYIDTVVLHGDAAIQRMWREGLAAIQQFCTRTLQSDFVSLEAEARHEAMASLLKDEQSPNTDLDRFMVVLKSMAIDAYSASEVGLKHFGYRGNRAVRDFPGCRHPEHLGE